jgi:hypothetical protein
VQLWRQKFHDGRNSNRCDSEIQENTHMSKVGGRKRKESALFDLETGAPKRTHRRWEVTAQHYSMVTLPCAEPEDSRAQWRIERGIWGVETTPP